MEQNKSNFSIPAEQRQKWYSIAMVWIGAMICVSSLMVGGMLGNGMKLGTCALTIVVGYGIVCIYMCFMGMQGCDTGLPTAVMAGGSLGEKGGKSAPSWRWPASAGSASRRRSAVRPSPL